jgi:hypothetical protein
MMPLRRKPDVGAPGFQIVPQTNNLDPMNLMNSPPAGKGENFPFPLPLAATRLMRRFELSASLARDIARLNCLGGDA